MHQAIIWINDDLLSTGAQGTYFSEILFSVQVSIEENPFKNVVCKMAAMLSRPQFDHPNTQEKQTMAASHKYELWSH